MKTYICASRAVCLGLGWLALNAVQPAAAQDPNSFPTVTISATDAQASEAGADTGTFTVRRAGSTNLAVLVFFRLGGTASNGVDYETISGPVQIPAGARTASFIVKPIDDVREEGSETVLAQITESPLACAACGYNIGVPSNAVVVIADNDAGVTNHPPFVQLNAPQDGDVFTAPANIALRAYAQDDEDGYSPTVEFFAGTNSLGLGTFVPTLCPAPFCPFFALTWSNVPPGHYELTARATDSAGAVSVSAVARVTVTETNIVRQSVVNLVVSDDTASEIPEVPPWLDIAQRVDPAVFTVTRTGPTDFPMTVFYSVGGTASNGADYDLLLGRITIPGGAASAPIEVWVKDDFEVEGTETVELTLQPPVCIAIFPPPPECYLVGPNNHATASILDNDRAGTNPPPVVSIVARDPFASEGTNFWSHDGGPNPAAVNVWNQWHVNVGGTNTATFVVRRHGSTDADLPVSYDIGGSASNGLDYAALSGSVVIPAGAQTTRIVVAPVDDSLAEGIETVLLSLRSSATYTLGFPRRAAAIILDNDRPRPPCVRLGDGMFHLCLPATNGFCFRVEASPDLRLWFPVCTNIVTDGALQFVDPDAASASARFYRTAPEPGLPPD